MAPLLTITTHLLALCGGFALAVIMQAASRADELDDGP